MRGARPGYEVPRGRAIPQIETAASLTAPIGRRSEVLVLRGFARAGRGGSTCSPEKGGRFVAQRLCQNMNHRRRDSPVAFCPNCGEVVNPGIAPKSCSEESHGKQRRGRSDYCVDCGEQLIHDR